MTNPQDSKEANIIPSGEFVIAELDLNSDAIKKIRPITKRTHYRAAFNFLTKYRPNLNGSNLDKIRGLLEAFFHFCEVEDWEKARKIAILKLNTSMQLIHQLQIWGLFPEQIKLAEKIAYKLTPEQSIAFLTSVATGRCNIGEIDRGIEMFNKTLEIARQINNQVAVAHTLNNLGAGHYFQGKFDLAIDYYQQALEVVSSMDQSHPQIQQLEANPVGNLATIYNFQGKYELGLKYAQKQLELTREIGDLLGEANALGTIGNTYGFRGDNQKAIDYYEEELNVVKKIGYRAEESRVLGQLGMIYNTLKDYDKALQFHQEAWKIAEETDDLDAKAKAHGHLGDVYGSLGEYDKAIKYLKIFLNHSKTMSDFKAEVTALSNLADVYLKLENYREAARYLQDAREIFKTNTYPYVEASVLLLSAKLERQLGNIKESRNFGDRALTIATELGIPLVEECQKFMEEL